MRGALFSDRRTTEGPPTEAALLVPNALAAPFAFVQTKLADARIDTRSTFGHQRGRGRNRIFA